MEEFCVYLHVGAMVPKDTVENRFSAQIAACTREFRLSDDLYVYFYASVTSKLIYSGSKMEKNLDSIWVHGGIMF